jgi:hypothetical protein
VLGGTLFDEDDPDAKTEVVGDWISRVRRDCFGDAHYEAELNAQRAILGRFGGPDQRVRFSPNRIVLETASGEPIESRENPAEPSPCRRPKGAMKGN